MKNTIKGLLNSKERINRLYFIDQLIHKYYISTDMIEVLDYISWRSPTTCYNSCQGTSLGNFKGERKYQFEKTNRQIFITYNSQQKPKCLGFFLNSVTWKMKIPLKKKLTGKKWNILKKIGKNGGYSWKKTLQHSHCRPGFPQDFSWWWQIALKCFWHSGFGTWPLKLWGHVRICNPNFSSGVTPTHSVQPWM